MAQPTDLEQFLLELINDARLNPMGNAARYLTGYSPLTSNDSKIQQALDFFNVSGTALQTAFQALTPTNPLAWNDNLGTAAHNHSQAQIAADQQTHQAPGEEGLGARLTNAGYTGWTTAGENVYAFAENAYHAHAGFMVDWGNGPNGMQDPAGHRVAIMNPNFTEIGIDVTAETNTATQIGPLVVTEDLSTRGKIFLLGVAYNDTDGDDFYSVGEGRSGLVVSREGASATSSSSGGYSLEIVSGQQTFTLTGGGLSGAVTVKGEMTGNVKLDVVNGTTLYTSGSITAEGAYTELRGLGVTGLSLTAGSGNELLAGSLGSDVLYGGAGTDVAEFLGASTAYTISGVAADMFVSGSEGRDRLIYIEVLRFTDGDFTWSPSSGLTAYTGGDPVGSGGVPGEPPSATVDKFYLTGSAFTDLDGNKTVSNGEGIAGLFVSRSGASTTSSANGSYTLEILEGDQVITFGNGGLPGPVTVTGQMNADVTINVVNGDTLYTSTSLTATGPITALRGLGTTGLSLTAGEGNQLLSGTPADDILYGGAGIDVAEFAGNSSSYQFSGITADVFVSGAEGRDRLIYIEVLRFSDGDFTWTPSAGLKKYTGTDAVTPIDPTPPVVPDPPVDPDPPTDPVDPGNPPNPDAGTGGFGRLYLTPGSQNYGPVPGGDMTEVLGSNQAERLTLAADVNAVLDPSFGRGNDKIVILGNFGSYDVLANVAGISITSGNGANIRIPAFGEGGGLEIQFNNGTFQLGTDDGGDSFQLTGTGGVQDIGGAATAIGGGSGSSGDSGDPSGGGSLDVGTATVAQTISASSGNVIFTDDASATTNVFITGMSAGDSIVVSNAVASDYNFQRSFQDSSDLIITYNDPTTGATNRIVIDDILPVSGAVSSLAAATATVGFEFMTFA